MGDWNPGKTGIRSRKSRNHKKWRNFWETGKGKDSDFPKTVLKFHLNFTQYLFTFCYSRSATIFSNFFFQKTAIFLNFYKFFSWVSTDFHKIFRLISLECFEYFLKSPKFFQYFIKKILVFSEFPQNFQFLNWNFDFVAQLHRIFV